MRTIEIRIKGNERDYVDKKNDSNYEVYAHVKDLNSEEGKRRIIDLVNQKGANLDYGQVRRYLGNTGSGTTIKFNVS